MTERNFYDEYAEASPEKESTLEGTAHSLDFVKVRVLPDGRMNVENAARYLGITKKTLANLRSQGKGPKATRVGGLVFYFKGELDAYVAGENY